MDMITLEAARVNAGYTLVEVGNIIERSPSTISGWENGQSEPKVSDAIKLANLYGKPIDMIEWKGGKK